MVSAQIFALVPIIAVMFTFSFGTAFADVQIGLTEAQQAEYDAAVGPNGVTLNAKFEVAWNALTDPWTIGSASYPISKKVYDQFKSDALKALTDEIYKGAANDENEATLSAKFATPGDIRNIVVVALGDEMAKAQFEIDYANEAAKLEAVDYSVYSDKAYNSDYTHKEKAVAIVDGVKAAIEAKKAALTGDSTIVDYKNAANTVATLVAADIQEVKIEGVGIGVYELKGHADVLKTASADAAEALTAAEKAALRADVAKEIATYKKNGGTDEALVTAYQEMFEVRIEAGSVSAINYGVASFASTKLKETYDEVQKLVATAEKYKAERDADGNLVRDAETVDDIVWAAKKDAYIPTPSVTWGGRAAAEADIIGSTVASEAAGLEYAQKTAKTLMDAKVADEKYYPAEQAKVDTLVAEFNAKVDAAKTADVAEALYTEYKGKLTTLNLTATKDKVNTALQTQAAYGEAKTVLSDYVVAYNKTVEDTQKLDNSDAVLKDVLNNFYGEKGARTNAELKALKSEVLSLVAKLPTAEAQANAKKAAVDAINAIPANVTLADEAAIQAAIDAVEAYKDVYGTQTLPSYTAAVDKLTALYKVDLYKKANAVDKTDKAAVKAVKAEFEAAADKDCVNVNLNTDVMYASLKTALANIKKSEADAVRKAINAIPVNVTEADKATVEAARAAYDAYVAEYTNYETEAFNGNAADEFKDVFRTLALAEATLGLNEDPIAAVESLKIRANTKAYKGYIRLKWTVTGDAEAADGYQIYRSTKSSSAGKKIYTTKKATTRSFKNTSVKKGTKYYYKVRAFKVVDGVTYYSDWSSRGIRTAK